MGGFYRVNWLMLEIKLESYYINERVVFWYKMELDVKWYFA